MKRRSHDTDKVNEDEPTENISNEESDEDKDVQGEREIVSLSDLIADLDNCESGTVFLNMLMVYMVFIVSFYFFLIISR